VDHGIGGSIRSEKHRTTILCLYWHYDLGRFSIRRFTMRTEEEIREKIRVHEANILLFEKTIQENRAGLDDQDEEHYLRDAIEYEMGQITSLKWVLIQE
jgi:hypothetical protein